MFLFAKVATREAGQGETDAGHPNNALHQSILHEMPENSNKEVWRTNGRDGRKIPELRLTVFWDGVVGRAMVEFRV
jgi:hypothetical protein